MNLKRAPNDIDGIYETLEGQRYVEQYHQRHKTGSCLILTMFNWQDAKKAAFSIKDEIKKKVVVEIGAGIGEFAVEMAKYAKKVIGIEVDPAWSWFFVKYLYENKPKNLIWIFGDANEIAEYIKADVAIICTRSGIEALEKIARKIARKVILFWQEEEPHEPKRGT